MAASIPPWPCCIFCYPVVDRTSYGGRQPVVASESVGRGPTLLKALTAVLTVLVIASVGYAIWIIIRYWGSVGV